MCKVRIFPKVIKMRNPSHHEDQIYRAVSQHLIRDVSVSALDIFRFDRISQQQRNRSGFENFNVTRRQINDRRIREGIIRNIIVIFFDNNPGAGNVIAGVGTTNSAGPAAAVAADPNGNPLNTGGYSPACKSADYAPDASGTCQLINNPNAKKSAPYQNLIDTAKTLMAIIAALALIAVIFEKSGYPITVAIAKVMKAVIVTLGVILLGLGAAILAQSGDMMMGGIVMAVGAATIATAFWGTEKLTATQQFTQMAVGSLIANSLGALLASSQSASQLE